LDAYYDFRPVRGAGAPLVHLGEGRRGLTLCGVEMSWRSPGPAFLDAPCARCAAAATRLAVHTVTETDGRPVSLAAIAWPVAEPGQAS
jgi:hypothetical protein